MPLPATRATGRDKGGWLYVQRCGLDPARALCCTWTGQLDAFSAMTLHWNDNRLPIQIDGCIIGHVPWRTRGALQGVTVTDKGCSGSGVLGPTSHCDLAPPSYQWLLTFSTRPCFSCGSIPILHYIDCNVGITRYNRWKCNMHFMSDFFHLGQKLKSPKVCGASTAEHS